MSLWNANTGKHLKTLKGHESFISSIAFSPDGGTLATGSIDGTARSHTGKNLIVLVAHEEGLTCLTIPRMAKHLQLTVRTMRYVYGTRKKHKDI